MLNYSDMAVFGQGSMRTKEFWVELARQLAEEDVVFQGTTTNTTNTATANTNANAASKNNNNTNSDVNGNGNGNGEPSNSFYEMNTRARSLTATAGGANACPLSLSEGRSLSGPLSGGLLASLQAGDTGRFKFK